MKRDERKERKPGNKHVGHRAREKKRFLEHGLENFNDINALELLLFFAKPQGDTNELAHDLLERFGSLAGVLEASPEELKTVSGVKEHTAVLLRLIPEISRRYMTGKFPRSEPVDNATAAGRYFVPHFMYERTEVVLALLLDARKHPICCEELSRGVVNAAEIQTRRLAELCLERRASAVVLAHNHLSGNAAPSREDEIATERLSRALAMLGVELIDHIIVADCGYVSMRECGLL